MSMPHIADVAAALNLAQGRVQSVAQLLAEGATIPFIARYRKEATQGLDEVAVQDIRDHLERLADLDRRKTAVIKSLTHHGHLNDELQAQVESAPSLAALEDLYLPYKPKRRTRGTLAREKGLEPLAQALFEQSGRDPQVEAALFIGPEAGVADSNQALAGARDIMAEWMNEDVQIRESLRALFKAQGTIESRLIDGQADAGAKFRDYFEWQEPILKAPSHRIMAMRRGENEGILSLTIAPPEAKALDILDASFLKGTGEDSEQVRLAIRDCYKRLLGRTMETEARINAKQRADAEAIQIFTENLKHLLMAPPLGAKRVLAIDPGLRTGCKVVCLDRQGKLQHHATLFISGSAALADQARETLSQLHARYAMEAIAVGTGTGGRETTAFLKSMEALAQVPVILVDESGASIYSASPAARAEFPDLDLTFRGAVSIGRRLMDPLAELVKIDPKSIGVGQYQHDVDPAALKRALDDQVISCVNAVGVDVNRASVQLLTYVSGLGPQLAQNIVAHRDQQGPFQNRRELLGVTRLGPKAFEQCAGFLRIIAGDNPLDASAVHPESYPVVEKMASDLNVRVADLMADMKLRQKIGLADYVSDTVGLPTLTDILEELSKPGRDPREKLELFDYTEGIDSIEDLKAGMRLPGIVTNVVAFGAFVDIGVHQDGLVHISELADRFIKSPAEVVTVRQQVRVTVLSVDRQRKRISLSMRKSAHGPEEKTAEQKSSPNPKPQSADRRSKPKGQPSQASGRAPAKVPFHNPFADILGKRD
ncbi:MAG: Tex family protein [Desulfobacterales bacterium]